MGLAELRPNIDYGVIPGSFNLPGRFGFGRTWAIRQRYISDRRVSICQADLGLAELTRAMRLDSPLPGFNLPGRFGFGRTAHEILEAPPPDSLFQSARQIWVWPNLEDEIERRGFVEKVSICQADLGLAERRDK